MVDFAINNIAIPMPDVFECIPSLKKATDYFPYYDRAMQIKGFHAQKFETFLKAVCEEASRRCYVDDECHRMSAEDIELRWRQHFGMAEEARLTGAPDDYIKAAEATDIALFLLRQH